MPYFFIAIKRQSVAYSEFIETEEMIDVRVGI